MHELFWDTMFALFRSSPRLWSCGTPSFGPEKHDFRGIRPAFSGTHDSSGPSAPHNQTDGAIGACGPSVDIRPYGSSSAFGSLFWEFIFGSFLLPKIIQNTNSQFGSFLLPKKKVWYSTASRNLENPWFPLIFSQFWWNTWCNVRLPNTHRAVRRE